MLDNGLKPLNVHNTAFKNQTKKSLRNMDAFNYSSNSAVQSADSQPLLGSLVEEEWEIFLKHVEDVRFAADTHIVRKGERDSSVYILVEGDVSIDADEAGSIQLARFVPGDVFGEIAFFDQAPRSAFVRALTPGRALRLTKERFDYLSVWEPLISRQFLFDLATSLANRLRWTTEAYLAAKDQSGD